ncbi:MAG: hypothetical protein H0T90_02975 [Gemmatimonadales bacterium]|nr:hypothetical protein [Gemmatimonadales bacterium]
MQMVQGEVALLTAETFRRDSVREAQLTEVVQMQQRVLDSLSATRRAVGQLRGDLAPISTTCSSSWCSCRSSPAKVSAG